MLDHDIWQAHIVRRDPREEHLIKMKRVRSNDLKGPSKSARRFLERSKIAQVFLKIIGVLGVSLVMSGMLYRDNIIVPDRHLHQSRWHSDTCAVCPGCDPGVG